MDATLPWLTGLANVYLFQGMYEEALKEFKKAIELRGGQPETDGSLAGYCAFLGKREEALKGLTQLLQRKYVSPTVVAGIHARLGDKEQAFGWLEKTYEEHDQALVFLKVHPGWEPLHSDPRFQDLLRRIGLPP